MARYSTISLTMSLEVIAYRLVYGGGVGGGGGGEGGLALFTSSVWEVGSIECSMAGKGVWHFPGYKFCELFKSRTVSVLNLATVDSRCV